MRSLRTLIGVALVAVAALPFAGGVAAGSAVVVRPGDVGTSWLAASSPGGSSSFVTGPATAPLGTGSLQFTTADIHAWAQLFNYSYIGTPLANFNAMSYSAYRASSSTNPTTQTIALALEVDVNGSSTAGGLATLIFEPDYQAGGNGAMKTDAWQTWDAYDGGNAVWWATEDIPGAPVAYNTFVPWSTILAANPDAIIVGGVGLFVGSGWDGQFTGFADALTIGVGGNTSTYDFEPKTQLVVTAPDASKVQGDPIPTLTPTYSGFLYGDTAANLTTQPTCATTASASSPVGTYPIICSGGASDNYSFTYTPGSLQVIPGETATPTVGPTQTATPTVGPTQTATPTVGPTQTATPTVGPTQIIEAATGTPSRAITPPPTSARGNLSSGGDSTPLLAVLICVAFGSLGLFVGVVWRRSIRL